MLYCNRCGYRIKINRAIKSHCRKEPYIYDCSCGNRFEVTAEDVKASDERRIQIIDRNYTGKRGRYKHDDIKRTAGKDRHKA